MGGPMRVGGSHTFPPPALVSISARFLFQAPSQLVRLRAPGPLLTSEGRGQERVDKAQSAVLRC
jgi:hypothetical protein